MATCTSREIGIIELLNRKNDVAEKLQNRFPSKFKRVGDLADLPGRAIKKIDVAQIFEDLKMHMRQQKFR